MKQPSLIVMGLLGLCVLACQPSKKKEATYINTEIETFKYEQASVKKDTLASGGQYLDLDANGVVSCTFEAQKGMYDVSVSVRSSVDKEAQRLGLFVNGTRYGVPYSRTKKWNTHRQQYVVLQEGTNTIEFRKLEGTHPEDVLDIDNIEINYVPPVKNIGPMVGHTTHNSSTIWYYAGEGSTVELRYGKAGTPGSELQKLNMAPRPQHNFTSLANLEKLQPKTDYQYEVWVDGTKAGEGNFSTAPIPYQPVDYDYLFASCTSFAVSKDQKAWDAILEQDYDFQMFHGDNVYANNTTHDVLWGYHMEQRSIPNFAEVLTQAPTYATWDDHDFGPNDSDGSEPGKEESLRLFKNVWSNPSYGEADNPGVYYTYMWGDVQYFVLDNRYHRTARGKGPENTQLGAKQRAWLLAELKKSRAPFKIILSGGTIQRGKEQWATYEMELKEIMNFVRDHKIYGVLFQGGDVHIVYFKKYDDKAQDEFDNGKVRPSLLPYETEMGYPLYDIISSGVAKHKKRPWSVVNVNTKLKDPTMTVRFYEQEKFKEEHVLKLSDLIHKGVKDLVPNTPFAGQKLAVGATQTIAWRTIGSIPKVAIEYKTDKDWMPIATDIANSGSYEWIVPNTPSEKVKIRVRDVKGSINGEGLGNFEIKP